MRGDNNIRIKHTWFIKGEWEGNSVRGRRIGGIKSMNILDVKLRRTRRIRRGRRKTIIDWNGHDWVRYSRIDDWLRMLLEGIGIVRMRGVIVRNIRRSRGIESRRMECLGRRRRKGSSSRSVTRKWRSSILSTAGSSVLEPNLKDTVLSHDIHCKIIIMDIPVLLPRWCSTEMRQVHVDWCL